jgi:tetratricopeptide (TPR) repeat protein
MRFLPATFVALALASGMMGCAGKQSGLESELASLTTESVRNSMTPEERIAMAHEAWIQAVSLDLRGQPQIALDFVQAAAFYDPNDRSLNISLARRLREFRRSKEALRVMQRAMAEDGPESSEEWELAAGLWLEAGQRDSADRAWTRVLQLDPHSREALLGKAGLAEAKNDLKSAAQSFARLAEEYGPNALPLLERAQSHWLKLGLPDSAIALFGRRWNDYHYPPEGEVYGRLLGSFGQTDRAVQVFDSLGTLEPEDAQKFALYAARFLLAAGRRGESLDRFRSILKDDPTSAQARASIGAVLLDLDSLGAANRIFQQMVRADSSDATAWYFLGLAANKAGLTDSARSFLDRSLQLDPKAIETWIRRGMLEVELDSMQQATKVFSRMVLAWPELAQSRFLYGYSLGRLAQKHLRHPDRELNPPDSEPITKAYRTLALAQFDTALRIDSLMQRARFERGSVLERLGRFDEALVDLRFALRLNPDDANTANYLGYLLADHDQSLPESDSLIASALRHDPSNPAYLDSRAWLRYRQRRFPEALVDIDSALASGHKDPTILQHKAAILESVMRIPEAQSIWKELLAADPTDPRNLEAKKRLQIR